MGRMTSIFPGLCGGRRGLRGVATLLVLTVAGCAHIQERHRLRVEPLEPPQRSVQAEKSGFQLRARRAGPAVIVEARAVQYCRDLVQQRAKGFRVTTREAVGSSLVMEWVMGGLISAAGAGVLVYGARNPPTYRDGELDAGGANRTYIGGGVLTAVGIGLLTAALVQQRSLGESERAIGVKLLKKQGHVRVCERTPATAGRVRLTLSDGHQIEADIGADGRAKLVLPADVEARLQRDGRRATLEAMGDWRSQLRITL